MDKDFKTLFVETLHNYGGSLAKLCEATGIPERYIEAMRAGNMESLPPSPYVRGYLNKISSLAGVDGEELWMAFKRESITKTSGAEDRLPENRFSLQKLNKSKVAGSVLVLMLLVYGLSRFDVIIGKPVLQIEKPAEALLMSEVEIFELTGKTDPKDKLTVNGENVIIGKDGTFKKEWRLSPGVNTLEFKVKRFLGLEKTETKKIIYTPQDTNTTSSLLLPQE